MATDFERLVLAFEASTTNVERQLKKLNGIVGRAMNDNARATDRFGNAISGTAARAENAAIRINRSLGTTRFATANVAAQFQDIGVQLASGASPFLVAIQQGTQLNQVLGEAGARGAVRLLGSAFASLLNPVSLATIAIIGLGGYAVQYFADLITQGRQSEETLKKQQDLIKGVADRWGDALPAIKEYADEQQRLKETAETQQALDFLSDQPWAQLRQQIGDLRIDLADVIQMIPRVAENDNAVVAVVRSFQDLEEAIKDGTATAEDAQRVHDALAQLFQMTGIPAVNDMASGFYGLADAIAAASSQAQAIDNTLFEGIENRLGKISEANAKFIADTERRNKLTAEELRLENEIARVRKDVERAGGFLSEEEARPIAEGILAAEDRRRAASRNFGGGRRSGGGGGRSSADSVQRVIENLKFEQEQLQRTNLEQEIYNQLKAAGVERNSAAGQAIEQEVIALDRQQQALKASEDAAKFFGTALSDAFMDLIPDIETGNRALDRFLNTLIEASAQALLFGQGPLASLFGFGGGGGLIGALFGRAGGGPVQAGRAYEVGENGRELFIPRMSGTIIPHHNLQPPAMAARAGPSQEVITINLRADDTVIADVADQRIKTASGTIVQVAVAQANDRVLPTMAQFQRQRAGGEYRV